MAGSPEDVDSSLLRRTMSIATAPELQEYVLQNITPGAHVGDGAYGNVTKLDYNGTLVAGKTLHLILLHADEGNLREKFVNECRLLKDLRHPHIVQFLGICFLPSSVMPVLVMEFLPYNLHDMLLQHCSIHMAIKLSVLRDVTQGLLYLHSQSPPIVHRDLSARNVLLNSALVAKIADFGVARIIDPQHLSRNLTSIPGAGVYMPPESAQSDDPLTYSNKLDIFSFGVLLLFVLIQEFPKDPQPATFMEANELKPRNELQRRQHYVTKAEQMLGDIDHPLLTIVRECLSNVVDRRPTAAAILERVNQLGGEAEDELVEKDKLQMIEELQRLQTECEELQRILYLEDELGVLLAEKERQIAILEEEKRTLNQSLAASNREIHSLSSSLSLRETEKTALDEELSRIQAELRQRRNDVTALRDMLRSQATDQSELDEAREEARCLLQEKMEWQREEEQLREDVQRKDRQLGEKREEVLLAKNEAQSFRSQLDTARADVQEKETELCGRDIWTSLQEQLRTENQQLRGDKRELTLDIAKLRERKTIHPPPQPGLRINFPLTFEPATPAPYGVNSAKAVQLGNSIVVAGGNADVDAQQMVMYYRPEHRRWNVLGKYHLSLFAMAVLGGNRMLVLVGGYDLAHDSYSNSLVHWDTKGKYWRPTFLPMPTARSDAAAVGYKDYLLVAGGSNGVEYLTTVEVLNTRTVQWSSIAPLPVPMEGLIQSVPLVNPARPQSDTWFIMGWESGLRQPADTFALSLSQLVAQLEGGEEVGWCMLPTPPLACCGAVAFKGALLAVGGKDQRGLKKKDIYLYLPGTCEWLPVAELPVAKHSCCCLPVPHNPLNNKKEFMIVGGTEATQFSTRVDIAVAHN